MLFYLAEPQLICKMKMNDIYFETVIMRIRSDVINKYLVVAAATINNHRNKKNNWIDYSGYRTCVLNSSLF